MAVDETPFEDVLPCTGGFSLPDLKFRELVFIGALRPEGDAFVRDPARPLPPFRDAELFPPDVLFLVRRASGRVELRPVSR